jgi:hypothetical protein
VGRLRWERLAGEHGAVELSVVATTSANPQGEGQHGSDSNSGTGSGQAKDYSSERSASADFESADCPLDGIEYEITEEISGEAEREGRAGIGSGESSRCISPKGPMARVDAFGESGVNEDESSGVEEDLT